MIEQDGDLAECEVAGDGELIAGAVCTAPNRKGGVNCRLGRTERGVGDCHDAVVPDVFGRQIEARTRGHGQCRARWQRRPCLIAEGEDAFLYRDRTCEGVVLRTVERQHAGSDLDEAAVIGLAGQQRTGDGEAARTNLNARAACHDLYILRSVHRSHPKVQRAAIKQDATVSSADDDVARGDQSAGHMQRAGS